jgi:hypothetical protein
MIFVAWHLGLGDAIACAAIVAKLAQSGDNITVPSWERNIKSVESLFVNYPNVKVEKVKPEDIGTRFFYEKIRFGVYNKKLPQLPDEDFVQWFYRQAGMDISEKEKYCPIKEATEIYKNDNAVYKFIHRDKERGFLINEVDLKAYYPNASLASTTSILKHSYPLMNAQEIHCIDSSFLHLAEALNVTGKKFYHKYARPNSTDFKYLKGWEVIN